MVLAHDEDVLPAALADIAVGIERDPFGVAVRDGFHLDQLRVRIVGDALGHGGRRIRRVSRPRAHLDVQPFLNRFLGEVSSPLPDHDDHVGRAVPWTPSVS